MVQQEGGSLGCLWERFCGIEQELRLFELCIGDAPVWERIRVPVFHRLVETVGIRDAIDTPEDRSLVSYMKALPGTLVSTLFRNPSRAHPVDLLFIGHPRRQTREDGTWWDLYCDPIIEQVAAPSGLSSLLLERPFRNRHRRPPRTDNIRYLDSLALRSAVARKLRRFTITDAESKALENIEASLAEAFDASIDVREMALRDLAIRDSQLQRYQTLLRRLRPRLVLLVVSYGNETIVEAARSLSIPTAEIQHGALDACQPGYSFSDPCATKSTFPDYFLAFGDFWVDSVHLPIAAENIFAVGYPYLEMEIRRLHDTPKQSRILFLSQKSVGRELSRVAVRLARAGLGYEIVYKLHPAEYQGWKQAYPWLVDEKLRVIDDYQTSIYELMAGSVMQVGVYSTALFEGLAFGVETFVYELPFAATVAETVEGMTRVHDVDQLLARVQCHRPTRDYPVDRLFRPDSTTHLRQAIGEILQRECATTTP